MATDRLSTSLTLALHARYEIAWLQHQAIEARTIGQKARIATAEQELQQGMRELQYSLEEADRVNQIEVDALRVAILFQMPTTWQEALVLAYHIHNSYDLRDPEHTSDLEKQALQTGLDLLLDFMFGEIDHDQMDCCGTQMLNLANIVYDRRHTRLGGEERQ